MPNPKGSNFKQSNEKRFNICFNDKNELPKAHNARFHSPMVKLTTGIYFYLDW